jgi:hypothetical protein
MDFNKQLKKQILDRDFHRCQECFGLQSEDGKCGSRLHVHHIDYNKKNNKPENLITLGMNCHMKTNFNRDEWQTHFEEKMIQLNEEVEPLVL